ncbi:adhesion protein, partial [Streptococcus canis]
SWILSSLCSSQLLVVLYHFCLFLIKQKPEYELPAWRVGSEMCRREIDRAGETGRGGPGRGAPPARLARSVGEVERERVR